MLSIDSRNIFFFSLCLLLSCCCCCCVSRHPREKRAFKNFGKGRRKDRSERMERTTRFSHRNHHARRKQKRRSRGKRESATRALPSQPSRSVSRARARARARLRKSKKTTKADLDVARQKRHFKPHFSKAHLFHILVAVVTLHVRLFFALRVRVVIVVRERDVVVRTGLVSSFFSSSSFRTHSSYFFLCPEECGRRRVSAKSVLFPPPFVLFFLANFQGLRNQIRLCGALFETALAQKKAEKESF